MKAAGASASTFFVSVLRPMRCCSRANGAGRPSFQTSTSPSSTVPSGSAPASAATSGKRSVISSSPRDHSHVCPSRRTSWARMPSYFHSTSHSDGSPSRAAKPSGSPSSAWARKKG